MLPTVVAHELRQSVAQFLHTAFPIATPFFQHNASGELEAHALIDDLVERPGELFKGPYFDIKLPFRLADPEALPFRHLTLPYLPYRHQLQVFNRLCGAAPQSTIVATGTGSGKTECFMLPVLDDCLHRREQGIKTLVIYPMNALATDQARRFAKEVAKLDTRITVGLFVGGEVEEPDTTMGPDNVITCHKTLRKNPPDILLTNYKMLDYLLLRPRDQSLWKHNKPGMLRYLVVDELHSFDGAQGTDLACLIRRLRDRLDAGAELACVGTSATMGGDSPEELLRYARQIFATEFTAESVIGEDRLGPDEYLSTMAPGGHIELRHFTWPVEHAHLLDPAQHQTAEDYLQQQLVLWFADVPLVKLPVLNAANPRQRAEAAVAVGDLLHRHKAFHELVHACARLRDLSELAADWQHSLALNSQEQARLLLMSLTSLVAAARLWKSKDKPNPKDWCQPFLYLRQQWWLRELRRLVCSVPFPEHAGEQADRPALGFADDPQRGQQHLRLPLLHCRECHLAAWGAVARKGDRHLNDNLQDFYQAWFGGSPQATLLVPLQDEQTVAAPQHYFCPACLQLQSNQSGTCQECSRSSLLRVWVPDILNATAHGEERTLRSHHNCPDCGARDAMTVVGYRAATLTSVMTGRLFSTPYNDDFKLIAFSDSVQDAAHRAGFLGANTWRQVIRNAMALWLRQQTGPLSLQDMREALPLHWRTQLVTSERFCGVFIAPNMEWLDDYNHLLQQSELPAGSSLPDLVSKRLAWELSAEFGRRSRIGRSLERSGMASVGFDTTRLQQDLLPLCKQLREEVEALRELSDSSLLGFVLGWLGHLRTIGAIYDPVLDSYLAKKGEEFLLNRLHWMPGFGRSQRPPAAISLQHLAPNFEALLLTNRDTWSQQWLKKTLGTTAVFVAAEARQIFTLLLHALTKNGWLIEKEVTGESVWLLHPERLLVEALNATLICSKCRHPLTVHPSQIAQYTDLPCLRSTCHGVLAVGNSTREAQAHGLTQPRRLNPHEHTGLLPRDEREWVEHSFIHGHEPWDINLLSATPTLEMGIDIGELSSVFLCSVPPAQANYLQRIGRAGRRDGNALAVTVANGQNHDLYFYGDPMEMMVGSVHTPGVFLNAIAVLERQLIAYSFDRWVLTGIDDSAIPGELRKVMDAVEYTQLTQFPYTLMEFVRKHRAALLSAFLAMFDHLDTEAREYLDRFISDGGEGSLSWRLVNRLQQLVEERKVLVKKTQQLKLEREKLLKQPQDEVLENQIKDMERERSAYLSLLTSMNRQPTLNFFTDEGLLPNYAFPEEGVTLRSVILRRRTKEFDEEEGAYEKLSFSFQRPAQTALSELAPESTFYAASHQLQIEQIDLQLSAPESWRFCNRCQHTERVDAGDRHSACPHCASAQWADSGQKHTVLKLRQVYSTVHDRYSRIGDDAEQREPLFFNRQMLVDIPEQENAGGFRINSETLPFGFEFVRRATFREVNFGPRGGESNIFSVAGEESPRGGFRICRHCGKVQKARFRRHEQPHAYICKLHKQPETETPEDYFDSLYLYRELNSEAIRILLPLSEVAYSDQKLHSFIAALNLGLRAHFRGNVQHLEVTDMHEPATNGSGERIYLVIYDKIPGGTGYLKELMRSPDIMMDMLQGALHHLQRCACTDKEGANGCYRCILAYRNSRNMDNISSKAAAELLTDILALRGQLQPVASLNDINTNVLIESKLEQRFVDALAALPNAQMSMTVVQGKKGSLLTLPGSDGRPMPWLVEHQIKVGPGDGVTLNTEIDVLLTPARTDDAARYRPIAVYLDGLQYHHDIVADDVAKRSALLRSGRFWVYSFNWDDLPEAGKTLTPMNSHLFKATGKMQGPLVSLYEQIAGTSEALSVTQLIAMHSVSGLAWLDKLLRKPDLGNAAYQEYALFRGFTALLPAAVKDAALRISLENEAQALIPPACLEALALDKDTTVFGGFASSLETALPRLDLVTALPLSAMQRPTISNLLKNQLIHLCFDDRDTSPNTDFKIAWRTFWHAANQLQFLPGFSFATRKSVETGTAEQVWHGWHPFAAVNSQPELKKSAWQDTQAWSSLPADLLDELEQLGLPEPEVGVDLIDGDGAVVLSGDSVELCWQSQRIAVITSTDVRELLDWKLLQPENAVIELRDLKAQGVF